MIEFLTGDIFRGLVDRLQELQRDETIRVFNIIKYSVEQCIATWHCQ